MTRNGIAAWLQVAIGVWIGIMLVLVLLRLGDLQQSISDACRAVDAMVYDERTRNAAGQTLPPFAPPGTVILPPSHELCR